jgi:hypothetical protein
VLVASVKFEGSAGIMNMSLSSTVIPRLTSDPAKEVFG